MQLIIIRSMQEFPSDQNQSSSIATIEKYNDISIPFDPAIYSFPQQLFHLLQIAEHAKQDDIISWAEDGKSFTVHDPNEFEATLLVKCFQMKKYASFTRQLCAYGFSCVRKGRKPGLCKNIISIVRNCDTLTFRSTHKMICSSFLYRLSPQLCP